MIQTHEAHSSAWPVGLKNQPEPHHSFDDRIRRAHEFVAGQNPPFDVYIDGWDDAFEQRFRAWPDKYYFVDSGLRLMEQSEYGAKADALVNYDCLQLCRDILSGDYALPDLDIEAIRSSFLPDPPAREGGDEDDPAPVACAIRGACK